MIIKDKFIVMEGNVRVTKRDAITGKIKYQSNWQKNLIPLVGLDATLRRWGNVASKSNEGMVTYGAIGNGSVLPTENDTIMENELARKPIATSSETGQTLTLEFYFTSAEGNGTITRWAMFGEEATASADTGTMFEHIAFASSFTKDATEDLTIEVTITMSYV